MKRDRLAPIRPNKDEARANERIASLPNNSPTKAATEQSISLRAFGAIGERHERDKCEPLAMCAVRGSFFMRPCRGDVSPRRPRGVVSSGAFQFARPLETGRRRPA